MNLIKDYDSNGCKVIMEVPSEGVTHAEITSLKLPELGEPSLQDRMKESLRDLVTLIDAGISTDVLHNGITIKEARALLASLEGEK